MSFTTFSSDIRADPAFIAATTAEGLTTAKRKEPVASFLRSLPESEMRGLAEDMTSAAGDARQTIQDWKRDRPNLGALSDAEAQAALRYVSTITTRFFPDRPVPVIVD